MKPRILLALPALAVLLACNGPAARARAYVAAADRAATEPWADAYLQVLRDARLSSGAEPLPLAFTEHLKSMGFDVRPGDHLADVSGRAPSALARLSAPEPPGPKWGKPEALALLAASASTPYGRLVRFSRLANLTADPGSGVPAELGVAPFLEALSDPDGAVVALGVAQAVGHPSAKDRTVEVALVDAMEKTPLFVVHYLAAQALKEATGQWFPVKPGSPQQDVAKWREYFGMRP